MKGRSPEPSRAFSMVEVAIALGIVSFALLTVLALLPMGMKSNQISAEETRAVNILSMLEADLRNTHPLANSGRSTMFGFVLPYALDASNRRIFNPAVVSAGTALAEGATIGLDEAENQVPLSGRPRFQVSVVYPTNLPPAGSTASLRARLVINWPALPNGVVQDLTDSAKTSGFTEVLVSFPAP
jgi:type II secretory pathway pseudopilin PulG